MKKSETFWVVIMFIFVMTLSSISYGILLAFALFFGLMGILLLAVIAFRLIFFFIIFPMQRFNHWFDNLEIWRK